MTINTALNSENGRLNFEVKSLVAENLALKEQLDESNASYTNALRRGYVEGVEDAAQACRYYLKYQNFSTFDSSDFVSGVRITCKNVKESIMKLLGSK